MADGLALESVLLGSEEDADKCDGYADGRVDGGGWGRLVAKKLYVLEVKWC